MPKFFVNEEQIQKEDVKVIGNDVKHIKKCIKRKSRKRVNNMQYFK